FQATGGTISIRVICGTLGYSRQYFYKQQKDDAQEMSRLVEVKKLIEKERKLLPRLGTRKLHWLIKEALQTKGIKCGRDKLFDLLRFHHMLIKPSRRYIQTTMSKHWMRKWPNIIKGKVIDRPEEVWVSDITYIKTREG